MRILPFLLALLLLGALLPGCGESSLHSRSSDYRYADSGVPLLSISREHFGGGSFLPDGSFSYPWGFRLENISSRATAESVRLLLRIRRGELDWDDHLIQLGDFPPKTTRDCSGEVSVIRDYTASQLLLIWQQEGRIQQVDLRENHTLLEDSTILRY